MNLIGQKFGESKPERNPIACILSAVKMGNQRIIEPAFYLVAKDPRNCILKLCYLWQETAIIRFLTNYNRRSDVSLRPPHWAEDWNEKNRKFHDDILTM